MGGDLNLKKSWHPNLRKNQERVWKEEKNALEERKLIEKLKKERDEERQIEELQKLQEAAGGKVATKRVEWMYAGPSGDGVGVSEEREAYLLGNRRIDGLLKGNESEALQKGAAVGIDKMGTTSVNSARDTQKKVLNDPLLMVQKQKMEMQIKAIKDAQKAKQYEEKRAKERERERKHKHRHSHRDRSRSRGEEEDRDRRYRRHHRDDRDGHRRRSRSRSPRRREDHNERSKRDSGRRRSRSRSRSPYRKSHRDDYRRLSRSRSPRRRDDIEERASHRYRDHTPPRRQHSDEDRTNHRRPPRRSPPRRSPPPRTESKPAEKESMAERLAKMQSDASSLEEQRRERVRLREAEDAAEEANLKANKDGSHRFISGVRRTQLENGDLGDAMRRGRSGIKVEVE